MRYIDLSIIDTNSPAFWRWKAAADRCYRELQSKTSHEQRSDYLASHAKWTDIKSILEETYGEKCWYSECEIRGEDGQIDHFRPKNKSQAEDKTVILEDGYWWLAYDYLNYRLSCLKSNQLRNPGGKGDFFPLREGTSPANFGESTDSNVLLDPCDRDDVNLIDCDDEGKIFALSSDIYNKKRVRVSNLRYNWDKFAVGRKTIRADCQKSLEIFDILYNGSTDNLTSTGLVKLLDQLIQFTDPKRPYSSFAKRYIRLKIDGKPYAEILSTMLKLNEL